MNHEKTIKRIQDLVKSVMELKEGCWVRHKTYKPKNIGKIIDVDKGYCIKWEDEKSFETEHTICDFKILGCDITIAVVLQALEKVNTIEKENYCITPNGGICFMGYAGRFYHQVSNWNLEKDNFNDQSEETKTFIGELLK